MRITEKQSAPSFEVVDITGLPVRIKDRAGRWTLLAFHRYSSCPFCNLRIAKLRAQQPRLAQQGLDIVTVFESSAANLREGIAAQALPFPVVSDPARELYTLYGAERSTVGLIRTALFRMGDSVRAQSEGLVPKVKRQGNVTQMPADFLVGPDLRIVRAHYGRDLGDHLPLPEIERIISAGSQQPSASA